MENICRFIPQEDIPDVIRTINFVYETKPQAADALKILSYYRMHYVTDGSGIIRLNGKEYKASQGDIFFIFPAVPHSIESEENFKYVYISYLGVRANQITDRLKITKDNFIFRSCSEIESFWKNALKFKSEALDLISESVLLYSFSVIAEKNSENSQRKSSKDTENILLIKKYIEDNFSDFSLSSEKISREFSYNKNYISTVFKKKFGVGISEYIRTVRIQRAVALIEQNFSSVKEIAYRCGFCDQLYFSKVFKEKIGMSPKKYIFEKQKEQL